MPARSNRIYLVVLYNSLIGALIDNGHLLGCHTPKNFQNYDENKHFPAKAAKQNHHISKTAQPIWTIFSGLLLTTNAVLWVVWYHCITSPRWRQSPFWIFGKR